MQILQRMKQKGFTLSELMAVVVIVAIIAGVALGSYRSITEKSVFNEGLGIAHAVAAAADEYYYEYNKKPSDLSKLVLDMKGITVSGNNITAKRFIGRFIPSSSVQITSKDYPYRLQVFMEYYGQRPDLCTGLNEEGINFCQSMGYTVCSGGSCSKE